MTGIHAYGPRPKIVRRALVASSLLGFCALLEGCSGAGVTLTDDGAKTNAGTTPTATSTAAVSAEEAARVRAYLDSFYTAKDVTHSFRTKFGEDVDCIDFYAQPSVRARVAQGEHVEVPEAPEPPSAAKRDPKARDLFAEAVGFNGELDENGSGRRCTGNTVPFIRKTAAQIQAAGGLDAYLKLRSQPPIRPPAGPQSQDVPGFFHVIAEYPLGFTGSQAVCGLNAACSQVLDGTAPPCAAGQTVCPAQPVQGGSAISAVYAPSTDAFGHSLSQTWTFSGNGVSDLTQCKACTTDCTQSVEVGWIMEPDFFTSTQNPNSPHLFVYSTQDGYWKTGAYANDPGGAPKCGCDEAAGNCLACANRVTDPFVQIPAKPGTPQFTPNMSVFTPSQIGAKPNEVTFETVNTANGKGWFVFINGVAIGNYPATIFKTSALPIVGSMANTAQAFWAGGEVARQSGTSYTTNTPALSEMGSGIGAPIGFEAAAYDRNIEFFVPANQPGSSTPINISTGGQVSVVANSFFSIYDSNPNCYNVGFGFSGTPATGSAGPGGNNWGNYMYYGGLGHNCGPFWSAFPGSCDACCTNAGGFTDPYCNQPPPPSGPSNSCNGD